MMSKVNMTKFSNFEANPATFQTQKLVSYAKGVLSKNGLENDPADLSMRIVERGALLSALKTSMENHSLLMPSGNSGANRDFMPDLKAIKEEIIKVVTILIDMVVKSIDEHSDFLKKDIIKNPTASLIEIGKKDFSGKDLLTSLVLHTSKLDPGSLAVKNIKIIYFFIREKVLEAIKSDNADLAQKMGKALGLIAQAVHNAKEAISAENEKDFKKVSFTIDVINDLMKILSVIPNSATVILSKMPVNLFKKTAESLYDKNKEKEQAKVDKIFPEKLLIKYYDLRHEKSSDSFADGYRHGRDMLQSV